MNMPVTNTNGSSETTPFVGSSPENHVNGVSKPTVKEEETTIIPTDLGSSDSGRQFLKKFFKFLFGASFLVILVYWYVVDYRNQDTQPTVRLAMVGNSMMYFNDLPRLLEAMAKGKLHQNSCLHGNADFSSHLWYGNGMSDKWNTTRL